MKRNVGPTFRRVRAYGVHLYTAFGVIPAFLAAAEVAATRPSPRWVFWWLALAVLIDATDGPLARRWGTKEDAAAISGRTIDDIVDYLTFTFLPLFLVWRMGWVPWPAVVWVAPALIASLLGFANVGAKEEEQGFFLGFPSYWNIYAYYAGLFHPIVGPGFFGWVLLALALLTLLPVRFAYPNLLPPPWRVPVLVGGAGWFLLLLAGLPWYPDLPAWYRFVSLAYPLFYVTLSLWLHVLTRTRRS